MVSTESEAVLRRGRLSAQNSDQDGASVFSAARTYRHNDLEVSTKAL